MRIFKSVDGCPMSLKLLERNSVQKQELSNFGLRIPLGQYLMY